jgi:hypothetical protein
VKADGKPRWFLAQLIFWPWRWRRYVPPKQLPFNALHGVISHKIVLLYWWCFKDPYSFHLHGDMTSQWPSPILNSTVSICMLPSHISLLLCLSIGIVMMVHELHMFYSNHDNETCLHNEEYHLLGYNAVYTIECQPTCRRDISAPSFMQVSCSAYFFDPEDGGDMFLRNVGWYGTDYTTLYTRKWYPS